MSDLSKKFDDAKDLSKAFDALPGGQIAPSDEYSALGAGTLGAAKGATFGFDDEIGGITKALWDKHVTGKKEDFWDLYSKVRDSIRQEHAAAEEQQPVASFAGEMAGGILPMALAPEAMLGKAAVKGASWLEKAKALGITGAKVGAVAGLGGSEADLTQGEVGQATKDTLGGAASGAAIGGIAMPIVQKGVGSLYRGAKNIATSFPTVNENIDIAKKAISGIDLLGKQNETTAMSNRVAQGMADALEEMRSTTGKARQIAIEAASDSGLTVDPHAWADKWITEAEAALPGANTEDAKSIQDFIKQIKNHVGEKTYNVDTYVPLESGLSPDELAAQSVKAKMTKGALADTEQAKQIEKSLIEDIQSGKLDPKDESDLTRIQAKLKQVDTLRSGNKFAPEIQMEPGTEAEGVINPRGPNKKPIVENIKENPFDAKVAHIMSQVTERDVQELTPTQVSKIATDLNNEYRSLGETQGRVRTLYGGAKEELQDQLHNAARLSPDAKEDSVIAFNKAIEGFDTETSKFGTVARTQEKMGQPGFAAVSNQNDKVMQLQNMIQNYNKPGSNARLVLDQALDQLSKAYPEEVLQMRTLIQDTARSRDLAMGLSAQSPLATNLLHASAKAVSLQLSRLGGLAYGGILKSGSSVTKNSSEALVNVGNAIYGASPEMIQSMADKGAALGGAFGDMIAKTLGSIVDAPQSKQRAVLFTLMQQPDFRKFTQEHLTSE